MAEPIISVSGLRGILGQSLSPDVAMRYACGFGELLPRGPIVLSYDGRASGPVLVDAIKSGLQGTGRDIIDIGVAATPTTGVTVRMQQAAGGIQVSASHNPPEYNGIKLFSAEGRVIPADVGEKVRQEYRRNEPNWVTYKRLGNCRQLPDAHHQHAQLIIQHVDVQQINAAKFHVVLDANHASGSRLGRFLLELLGCRVKVLGEEITGAFAHPPEPTAENLQTVLAQVPGHQAHIGFCVDPDADRLAIIDEQGRYLGEECTLALAASHVLRKRRGPLVTNCATSRMIEDLANEYGVPLFRTKVGEANVVDAMLKQEAILGGEGNGGVIDPRVGYVRDSFMAMALVLEEMAMRDDPVSQIADELPRYHILKGTVAFDQSIDAAFEELAVLYSDAQIDKTDGLRLTWGDRWMLVRPSNTEPLIRLIVEAPTPDQAEALFNQASSALMS